RTNLDEFINICIDGNYPIASMNGGDLYCVVGGSQTGWWVKDDWPPPNPYLRMTDSNRLLSQVLHARFGKRLARFTSGCYVRNNRRRVECFPFFSVGGYDYFGTAAVSLQARGLDWGYSYRLRRASRRCLNRTHNYVPPCKSKR